jgi:hypothetical protein
MNVYKNSFAYKLAKIGCLGAENKIGDNLCSFGGYMLSGIFVIMVLILITFGIVVGLITAPIELYNVINGNPISDNGVMLTLSCIEWIFFTCLILTTYNVGNRKPIIYIKNSLVWKWIISVKNNYCILITYK